MKSASDVKNIGTINTIKYWYLLLKMRLRRNSHNEIIPWDDFNDYEYFLKKYCPDKAILLENKVLEIGYGARPWRLIALNSLGVDIQGIDLERPMYGFNVSRLLKVLKDNGFERFLKSLVRGILFDLRDLKKINDELRIKGKNLIINEEIMKVGNAGEKIHFEDGSFTFAFSEDVLEHVPQPELSKLIDNLSYWLKKGSIVVLRPHVFTGISGGHNPDWYPHKVLDLSAPKESAWEHLLDKNFKVNTYLNKLKYSDYLKMFEEKFELLEIKQRHEKLGESYLTSEIYDKLKNDYSREELLINQIALVLRVK